MQPSYDALASEYYDPVAHPTCYNFNRLSRIYLQRSVPEPLLNTNILEIGAGDSSAAAILHARGYLLDGLEITDASAVMLAYSERWVSSGCKLSIADAHSLPREDGSVALLVAGLGDAYNVPEVWREISRVIEPGGKVLFTIPSFQWAARFRLDKFGGGNPFEAEFQLRDGRVVTVPSFILPLDEQIRMMEDAGLMIVNFESLGAEALPPIDRSSKLDVFSCDASSLVWGFKAIRQTRLFGSALHQLLKECPVST